MSFPRSSAQHMLAFCCFASLAFGQGHQPAAPDTPRNRGLNTPAAQRGQALFQSNCGFCHGADAAGSRAPNLIQSALVNHDENGNQITPVIQNGRADKGMPAFPNLKDDQIADIVTFIHARVHEASHNARVPSDYPVAKLLTGNAEAGRAYFEGAGGCTGCHSTTKAAQAVGRGSLTIDLSGVANKYSPVDLQQRIVYPQNTGLTSTATITTTDGQHIEGTVKNIDEFSIGLIGSDGWFRSWPRHDVKVDLKDPLEAHRELTRRLTDADLHNLFAYLETLK